MDDAPRPSFFTLPPHADPGWMMQPGEKWAIQGLLSLLRPRLAIEIGTYDGGSLRAIAAHSDEVHGFDIDPRAQPHADALPNATMHLGDAAQTVPAFLAQVAAQGRHVDFALVDGLHTYDAVTTDARSLLESPACTRTVIVFHDAAHAEVRRALADLYLAEQPKVGFCSLDFVPGYLVRDEPALPDDLRGRAFNGLALVVLDPERDPAAAGPDLFVSVPELHAAALSARRGG